MPAPTQLTPDAVRRAINNKWGEGTMRFGSDPTLRIERIPSGILSLDVRLGGGFARGRSTEIYGPFSVGKSYTAARLIASAQELGLECAYVDAEHTFDPVYAASIGVDLDSLAYHRQVNGNRCVDFMETLLRSELYGVIVLDSIAALSPKSEQETDMEAGSMGTEQAKLMSKALRKLTTANNKTALIFINQTREAVGVMFGNRSITSGGKAMGFYAGTRIEMVRTENIKRKARVINPGNGNEQIKDVVRGHRVLVRITKDKTGGTAAHSETSFVFDYEIGGVDHVEDLVLLGREFDLVHKSGNSWWVDEYEDEKAASRSKFVKWLRRNVAVQEELEEWIRDSAAEVADLEPEEDEDE